MKNTLFFFSIIALLSTSCNQNSDTCTDCDGIFSENLTMTIFEEYGTDADGNQPLLEQHEATFNDTLWTTFSQDICGFNYVPGFRYKLSVKRKKTGEDENGNKIYNYCLIKIEEAVKVYL